MLLILHAEQSQIKCPPSVHLSKNIVGAILAHFYRLWYKEIGFGQQVLKPVVLYFSIINLLFTGTYKR